jgi:hypothetical protein
VSISPNDSLTVRDFAALFGFPPEAVVQAIEAQKYRSEKAQAFFTLPQLMERWQCSRAQVYAILREANVKVVDLGLGEIRAKTLVPAATVERIEKTRTGRMP